MAPSTVSFPTVSVRFRKPTLNTRVVWGGVVWCGVVWGVVWGGGVSLRCWEEAAYIHIQSP